MLIKQIIRSVVPGIVGEAALAYLEHRSRLVFNYMFIIGVAMTIAMMGVSAPFGLWRIVFQYALVLLLFIAVGILMRARIVPFILGKTAMFVAIIANTVTVSLYWGRNGGCNLLLLVLSVLSYIAFTRSEKAVRYIISSLGIAAYLALEIYFVHTGSSGEAPLSAFLITTISTLLILVLCLHYFVNTIYSAQDMLNAEKAKSESLLENILPMKVIEKLKLNPEAIAENYRSATILFADIAGFTEKASRMRPLPLVRNLNEIYMKFDDLVKRHNVEKIKTIGDAYMIVSGAPERSQNHLETMLSLALDMQNMAAEGSLRLGKTPIDIRVGVNTGPIVAGIIGKMKYSYDLWGDTVNTASRLESSGAPGRIHTSEAVYKLMKSKFMFDDGGVHEMKGKGRMHTYYLIRKKK